MHLLYLDDSGSVGDASQHHFVLAGISIFERQGHWLSEGLDKVAARFDAAEPFPRNLAEVPVFLDSRASRLIQLADLVAYSVFQKFERGDTRFFDIITHRFDAVGGVVHGLCVHPPEVAAC